MSCPKLLLSDLSDETTQMPDQAIFGIADKRMTTAQTGRFGQLSFGIRQLGTDFPLDHTPQNYAGNIPVHRPFADNRAKMTLLRRLLRSKLRGLTGPKTECVSR
jgi:hypothetical protein